MKNLLLALAIPFVAGGCLAGDEPYEPTHSLIDDADLRVDPEGRTSHPDDPPDQHVELGDLAVDPRGRTLGLDERSVEAYFEDVRVTPEGLTDHATSDFRDDVALAEVRIEDGLVTARFAGELGSGGPLDDRIPSPCACEDQTCLERWVADHIGDQVCVAFQCAEPRAACTVR